MPRSRRSGITGPTHSTIPFHYHHSQPRNQNKRVLYSFRRPSSSLVRSSFMNFRISMSSSAVPFSALYLPPVIKLPSPNHQEEVWEYNCMTSGNYFES